ncbi:MAG TPA: hypothetical protein VNP72_02155, partial [Longimicrobium sp.]|nr:hypothetical protein [Longimicrobium sp.]
MNAEFESSFLRDVRNLANEDVSARVRLAILAVEAAPDIRSVPNLKKLSGSGPYYRIRIGEYR